MIEQLKTRQERERIDALAPEDVDISDLDPAAAETWDDMQWYRAERSGMMGEPGIWEKVDAAMANNEEPKGKGPYSV